MSGLFPEAKRKHLETFFAAGNRRCQVLDSDLEQCPATAVVAVLYHGDGELYSQRETASCVLTDMCEAHAKAGRMTAYADWNRKERKFHGKA